jgi:hypothetical protein
VKERRYGGTTEASITRHQTVRRCARVPQEKVCAGPRPVSVTYYAACLGRDQRKAKCICRDAWLLAQASEAKNRGTEPRKGRHRHEETVYVAPSRGFGSKKQLFSQRWRAGPPL